MFQGPEMFMIRGGVGDGRIMWEGIMSWMSCAETKPQILKVEGSALPKSGLPHECGTQKPD